MVVNTRNNCPGAVSPVPLLPPEVREDKGPHPLRGEALLCSCCGARWRRKGSRTPWTRWAAQPMKQEAEEI
jgi:hypothetical protein